MAIGVSAIGERESNRLQENQVQMHVRNHFPLVILTALSISVGAFAQVKTAKPAPSPAVFRQQAQDLTTKLTAENATLHDALDKFNAQSKLVTASRAKIADLKKQLATTTNAKSRADVEAKVAAANKEQADLFAVLLQYQVMVQKEVREDRRIADQANDLALSMKGAKLDADSKAIEAQMEEARKKAEAAMEAASTQMLTSIVGSVITTGSSAAASTSTTSSAKVAKPAPTK